MIFIDNAAAVLLCINRTKCEVIVFLIGALDSRAINLHFFFSFFCHYYYTETRRILRSISVRTTYQVASPSNMGAIYFAALEHGYPRRNIVTELPLAVLKCVFTGGVLSPRVKGYTVFAKPQL